MTPVGGPLDRPRMPSVAGTMKIHDLDLRGSLTTGTAAAIRRMLLHDGRLDPGRRGQGLFRSRGQYPGQVLPKTVSPRKQRTESIGVALQQTGRQRIRTPNCHHRPLTCGRTLPPHSIVPIPTQAKKLPPARRSPDSCFANTTWRQPQTCSTGCPLQRSEPESSR